VQQDALPFLLEVLDAAHVHCVAVVAEVQGARLALVGDRRRTERPALVSPLPGVVGPHLHFNDKIMMRVLKEL
jgi:hypothetical protein